MAAARERAGRKIYREGAGMNLEICLKDSIETDEVIAIYKPNFQHEIYQFRV